MKIVSLHLSLVSVRTLATLIALSSLTLFLAPASSFAVDLSQHEALVVFNNESGVISNLLLNYNGSFNLGKRFNLLVGGSVSLGSQWGPELLGVSGEFKIDEIWSHIVLGVQQERWSDWDTTENRAVLYWVLHPFFSQALSLSFGEGYRAPQYAGMGIYSLWWPKSSAEFNPIYRFEWKFLSPRPEGGFFSKFGGSVLIFDYDRMRLFTWDNTHFTIIPDYALNDKTRLELMLGTAVKGASGAVISWDQLTLGAGFKYEF